MELALLLMLLSFQDDFFFMFCPTVSLRSDIMVFFAAEILRQSFINALRLLETNCLLHPQLRPKMLKPALAVVVPMSYNFFLNRRQVHDNVKTELFSTYLGRRKVYPF